MEYQDWIAQRISQLRIEKGISARDMSLSLGQSESYINKIENKRTMPSMTGFFYICEYLGVSPKEFFDQDSKSPPKSAELMNSIKKLKPSQAEHIIQIIKDLAEK